MLATWVRAVFAGAAIGAGIEVVAGVLCIAFALLAIGTVEVGPKCLSSFFAAMTTLMGSIGDVGIRVVQGLFPSLSDDLLLHPIIWVLVGATGGAIIGAAAGAVWQLVATFLRRT